MLTLYGCSKVGSVGFGIVGKTLGGYAARIEACATSLATLDDDDLFALLSSVAGGTITARTAAYDNDICLHAIAVRVAYR